ncbi:GTP cyclohydrolase I FolE [Hwangdonia lutea]|uniref:GTP cyclohydrolase 1 n=1 Tax=Hwangdonia lutea TaxID=3075823 RepID=A0AA97ELA7_9FLAO|nr:GTP cyclohydrolase I FolE [Hwangdonia sp. SCSIO 19198]WOD43207.1 GTP cyclohydrolase I FolE [Hwangdonia sp. SCSIO 19198]
MKINGKGMLKTEVLPNNGIQELHQNITHQEKLKVIEYHFGKIMETLGLSLDNPSLKNTPKRVAKMYINEVFKGLDESNFPKISFFENVSGYREMVVVDNITVHSYCEHHFVPFFGKAAVAYIPKDRVIGLSKINRIVQFYASKPQIQEKLTVEIGQKLKDLLKTDDVAIYIEANHLCVASRGIKDKESVTKTTFFSGKFLKDKEKARFINSISK